MQNREATLILVRHGRTAWSDRQIFSGNADVPLSPAGVAQAQAVARRLVAFRPGLVVTSDLSRATATGRAIGAAGGVPVVEDRRLRDEHVGAWEGLTRDEVAHRYSREHARWRAYHLAASENREGLPAVAGRALAAVGDAFDDLPGTAPVLVAVTHVNTAIALTGRLLGLAGRALVSVGTLAHGAFSVLDQHESGVWTLRAHNVGADGPPPVPLVEQGDERAGDAHGGSDDGIPPPHAARCG